MMKSGAENSVSSDFSKRDRGRKDFVNKRSVLGKDAIDFGLSIVHFAGEDHSIGTGSKPLISGQFPFQRFYVTRFMFKAPQGVPELFSRLRSKLAEEFNDLGREVDLGHASSEESGRNFVRPFS